MTEYLAWLISKIAVDDNREKDYEMLLEFMLNIDYYWDPNIPLDESREMDGLCLRKIFIEEVDGYLDPNNIGSFVVWASNKRCSILEMFIALCLKLTDLFNDVEAGEIFWLIIDNLGLSWSNDNDFDMDISGRIFSDFLSRKITPFFLAPPKIFSENREDLWMMAGKYLKKYLK